MSKNLVFDNNNLFEALQRKIDNREYSESFYEATGFDRSLLINQMELLEQAFYSFINNFNADWFCEKYPLEDRNVHDIQKTDFLYLIHLFIEKKRSFYDFKDHVWYYFQYNILVDNKERSYSLSLLSEAYSRKFDKLRKYLSTGKDPDDSDSDSIEFNKDGKNIKAIAIDLDSDSGAIKLITMLSAKIISANVNDSIKHLLKRDPSKEDLLIEMKEAINQAVVRTIESYIDSKTNISMTEALVDSFPELLIMMNSLTIDSIEKRGEFDSPKGKEAITVALKKLGKDKGTEFILELREKFGQYISVLHLDKNLSEISKEDIIKEHGFYYYITDIPKDIKPDFKKFLMKKENRF